MSDPRGSQNRFVLIGLVGASVIAALVVAGVLRSFPREPEPYTVIGFNPMTADDVSDQFFLVAPEMLTAVYEAFNETGEAEIYDSLARVAAEEALEALYLERVGAMAGGGLNPSEEADQEIHTMEMIRIDNRRDGETFTWDARWRVVGTVGHTTHLHVRGNIYAAILTLEPVDGSWRFTDFELTDVDRAEAGQFVPADDNE